MAETIRAATVRDRVIRVIAHYLGIAEDAVAADKKVTDLDAAFDDIDGVELVMEFEDEFEMEIDDDDAQTLVASTVEEIANYISGRTGQ